MHTCVNIHIFLFTNHNIPSFMKISIYNLTFKYVSKLCTMTTSSELQKNCDVDKVEVDLFVSSR